MHRRPLQPAPGPACHCQLYGTNRRARRPALGCTPAASCADRAVAGACGGRVTMRETARQRHPAAGSKRIWARESRAGTRRPPQVRVRPLCALANRRLPEGVAQGSVAVRQVQRLPDYAVLYLLLADADQPRGCLPAIRSSIRCSRVWSCLDRFRCACPATASCNRGRDIRFPVVLCFTRRLAMFEEEDALANLREARTADDAASARCNRSRAKRSVNFP